MNRNKVIPWVLFLLTLLYPVLILIEKGRGYEVSLRYGALFPAILTGVYLALSVLMLTCQNTVGRLGRIALAMTLSAGLINVVFFILAFDYLPATLLAVLCHLLAVSVAVMQFCRPLAGKIVLCAVPSAFIAFFLLIDLFNFIAPLGNQTVIVSQISPDGGYRAEVVDFDMGAMGSGSTDLYVYQQPDAGIPSGPFILTKGKKLINSDPWNTYRSLRWISDDELVYNGVTFRMSDHFR